MNLPSEKYERNKSGDAVCAMCVSVRECRCISMCV
jgi:hypothetical protein